MEEKQLEAQAQIAEKEQPARSLSGTAKKIVDGMLSPFRGREVAQMVEQFTEEVTLVTEGLSEDQVRLTERVDKYSAQQTILEQEVREKLRAAEEDNKQLRLELASLRVRLEQAERAIADKKLNKVEGFTGMIRQGTWLVGIGGAAWIITAILNLFH